MSQWQRDDMVILAHIREQHRLSLQSYGRPRMTEELQELGVQVGHRRVGRLMRENGIKIIRTRKYKVTTDSNHAFNIASNLLDQDFSADGPNQKWAGDISYIWTSEGWLYLAVILDLYSRRVIGWASSHRYCVSTAAQWSATASSGIWQSGHWTWLWHYASHPKAAFTTRIVDRSIVQTTIRNVWLNTGSRFP